MQSMAARATVAVRDGLPFVYLGVALLSWGGLIVALCDAVRGSAQFWPAVALLLLGLLASAAAFVALTT